MKYLTIVIPALLLLAFVDAQCPKICPAIYIPTCGFNGRCYKSYSNPCSLNAESCSRRQNIREVAFKECEKRGARLC